MSYIPIVAAVAQMRQANRRSYERQEEERENKKKKKLPPKISWCFACPSCGWIQHEKYSPVCSICEQPFDWEAKNPGVQVDTYTKKRELKKQPVTPNLSWYCVCPNKECGWIINKREDQEVCHRCGQAIDWRGFRSDDGTIIQK